MAKRILLVNPPSSRSIYQRSKVRAAIFTFPPISLATLGGALLEQGAKVRALDMAASLDPWRELEEVVQRFAPDDAGITFTTPLYNEALEISRRIKGLGPQIRVIGGGPHASAQPKETLLESTLDGIVVGEGEQAVVEMFIDEKPWHDILGLTYKDDGHIVSNGPRPLIRDLDTLPMPAWSLFDSQRYICSKIISRANPVAAIETSRGCPFGCIYCSKAVFGRKVRFKSPERVVREIEALLALGFREVHIIDDLFTADLNRAKRICDLIVERGLHFPWQLPNGIRVTHVDQEFVAKAGRAGCYSIGLGVESGSQQLLDNVDKRHTLEQCRQAVKVIQNQGLEVVCFFIIGLPGETKETMEATINFACELDPDFAKVTIMFPLPGTPLFERLMKEGRLLTTDWALYSYHYGEPVFEHWTLDAETLARYYHRFYRRFYLRPRYVFKRLRAVLSQGNLVSYAGYFVQTWMLKPNQGKETTVK